VCSDEAKHRFNTAGSSTKTVSMAMIAMPVISSCLPMSLRSPLCEIIAGLLTPYFTHKKKHLLHCLFTAASYMIVLSIIPPS
jgi:hypothetical protein